MSKTYADERSLTRIVGFSDAVYAIAITILVLTVEIPTDLDFSSNAAVWKELMSILPQFISYAFSFYLIGLYWVIHHKMFRQIVKYDDKLLLLNLINLFFITFIPVPTMILNRAGDTAVGAAFYAFWIALCSISVRMLYSYATEQHRLVDQSVTKKEIYYANMRGLIPAVIFLVSIPIAFINPYYAEAMWLLMILVRPNIVEYFMKKYRGGE